MVEKMKMKYCVIFLLRYLPVLGALIMLIHVALLIFDIRIPIAENLIGLSIMPYIFSYFASKAFGFCWLHRAFLTYIFIVDSCINFQRNVGFSDFLFFSHISVFVLGIALFVKLIVGRKNYCV